MNKPIIAIFLAHSIATSKEQELIDQFSKFPHIIMNAETYDPNCTLLIDAVCGCIPENLSHLPDPKTVIEKWQNTMKDIAVGIGGKPPQPPDPPKQQSNFGNGFGDIAPPPTKDNK